MTTARTDRERRPAILSSVGTTAAVKFSDRAVPAQQQSRTASQMSNKSKPYDQSGTFL